MPAQPIQSSPDDPSEILRLLPAKWHEQFLTQDLGDAFGLQAPKGCQS